MDTYALDIDPGQLVRWLRDEQHAGSSAVRVACTRRAEAKRPPADKELHLGDEERENLSEIVTIATLEVHPVRPAEGWQLAITVEDEVGRGQLSDAGDLALDLDSFYGIFIRSDRGIASVTAEVSGPAGRRHLDGFLHSVESNLHPVSDVRGSPRRGDSRRTWRIAPNSVRHASEWWDYARASPAAPRAAGPLLAGAIPPEELRVTHTEAAEIAVWARTLPGWDAPDAPPVLAIEPAKVKSRLGRRRL
jgi:hypothetical protein